MMKTPNLVLTQTEAREQLELLRNGMPAQRIYVPPHRAASTHTRFVERLKEGAWGFLLIHGENGAGKTTYLRILEDLARGLNYAVIHVELDDAGIRTYGGSPWLSLVLVSEVRLPDGTALRYAIENDPSFRTRVHSVLEANQATLRFWSPALATMLSWATQDQDHQRMHMAQTWLRGESLYVSDLRSLEVYDSALKSILKVPPDRTVHFMNALVRYLGARGLLLCLDEVERAGNLPPVRGREALSSMRDLINILVDDTAQPTQQGITNGVFICFAISTFFLGYSGVLDIDEPEYRARVDRLGRPKVSLGDVPRLARVLAHSAARIETDFQDLGDLAEVARVVRECYRRANGLPEDTPEADELAKVAYDRTGNLVAGYNVQAMISYLDELGDKSGR